MEMEEARREEEEEEAIVEDGEVEMEMEADADMEEAGEEGEIGRGGARVEEVDGNGVAGRREEDGAINRRGIKKKQQQQQRAPMAAGYRGSWMGRGGRGRGGGGRGGFHHRPWYGAKNLQHHKPSNFNKPGAYGGAIIICNRMTKRECFQQKLFGLPGYAATFIKKIKAGMLLFLFEHEERKLYGVFEATSDGALNILPNAFASFRKFRPSQVLFRRVWFCKPLTEAEFSDAMKGNYLQPHMSFFGISQQQVVKLVHLFSSKRIALQPYQKPKSRVICDYEISLAHTGQVSSLHTRNNACPSRASSLFGKNRTSLPHSLTTCCRPFMHAKQNTEFAAYKYKSPLHPQPKPVIFNGPGIEGKSVESNADYIPLELDDCKSDSDADMSHMLETVSFFSTLEGSISYEDPRPFNGKFSENDGYHSPVLDPRLISESEAGQNSVFSHIVKQRQPSRQAKGCKRKAIFQFDEHLDLSSPRRGCTMAKKVSFSFGDDEILVTSSDKAPHRPALAELEQNKEAAVEGKQEVGCSVEDIQSKGRDVSAKRSKLMSLSFPGLINQHAQSCSRNTQSLVTQPGIKLTCRLLTDEE